MIKYLVIFYFLVRSIQAGCYLKQNSEDCRLRYKHFYDFGPSAGDKSLPKSDDVYVWVQTPGSFKLYDRYYSAFYLSTNGAIELLDKNDTFKLHEKFNFDSVPFPIADHAIIAPFWSDHVPEIHGEVYYRISTEHDTLAQIANEVNLFKPSKFGNEFIPTWSSIITWYQLKAFNHRRFSYNNTYQLVLASDGEASYVMFNYANLQWPNKDVKMGVSVGYNLGDNETFFQLEQSVHSNLMDLQYSSNVDLKSRWMYRVDDHKSQSKSYAASNKIDNRWFCFLLILIIVQGIITIGNSALWIAKFLKQKRQRPSLQLSYRKQLNESHLCLNQDI